MCIFKLSLYFFIVGKGMGVRVRVHVHVCVRSHVRDLGQLTAGTPSCSLREEESRHPRGVWWLNCPRPHSSCIEHLFSSGWRCLAVGAMEPLGGTALLEEVIWNGF